MNMKTATAFQQFQNIVEKERGLRGLFLPRTETAHTSEGTMHDIMTVEESGVFAALVHAARGWGAHWNTLPYLRAFIALAAGESVTVYWLESEEERAIAHAAMRARGVTRCAMWLSYGPRITRTAIPFRLI